jgi:hypothetical protein
VSILVRTPGGWVDAQSPSVVVGGVRRQVVRGQVRTPAGWVRFFPHEETTQTVVTDGLSAQLSVGVGSTVRGTVTPFAGGVAGGTVTAYERVAGGAWRAVGQSAVAPAAGAASFGVSVTPTECGTAEFKVVYSGTPTNAGSESAVAVVPVGLNTPAKPTGGAITETTLTFSWAAVPGATSYEVFRNNLLAGTVTGLSFTDTGLAPAMTYDYTVRAKRGTCLSSVSAVLKGTTSRTQVQDTGTATIKIDPLKTGSYRPSDGWGYISSNVGQGYYSTSSNNYTGVIDFGTNAQFKAKIAAAIGDKGAERAAHLTITKAEVYLFKQTGVGSSGSVTASFQATAAEANVGGLPARQGTAVNVATTSSGSAKWYDIGTALASLLLSGAARSLALFNATTANYLRFNGKGLSTDSCVLRLTVSWDYMTATNVPGGWA